MNKEKPFGASTMSQGNVCSEMYTLTDIMRLDRHTTSKMYTIDVAQR